MKMIVTINKTNGTFSHPFFAPTIEDATQAMTKINPENMADIQFHELCEFKDNTDIFRLKLGPQNPTSKKHLDSLIATTNETLKAIYESLTILKSHDIKPETPITQALKEYQIACLRLELTKYNMDKLTIYESLADE